MIHRLFRRRSTDDNRADDIWLTVYSDLVTNLMLVFLALYGIVTMGNQAIEQASTSMKAVQTGAPVQQNQSVLTLDHVAQLLRQEFGDNKDIAVIETAGVTRIQFGESVLFASGQANLKSTAQPILTKTAALLALLPYTIVVEGHTDDQALRKGLPYRDNWELSLARSMSVVKVLSQEGGIPSRQIAAAAYGENRPRASNLMPDSRKMNRRVEIALFRDVPFSL